MHQHTISWSLSASALNGTGGFDNGNMLAQYPRESDSKFKARKEVAYYVNHMKRSCQRFASYLAKESISREVNSELLKGFVNNADMMGNSLSVLMHGFSIEAKARGSMLMLVDMPKLIADSQSEQIAQRKFPYLVPIEPERVTRFEKDMFGGFDFVEFNDTHMIDGEMKQVIRRYDKKGWAIRDGEDVIDHGTYNINACPIIAFTESGAFPYVGSYNQIADVSKRLYNAQSELTEILRGQTFSILTYHIPPEKQAELEALQVGSAVGTSNMLAYYGQTPSFISPTAIPAKTYQDYIARLEEKIDEVANNVDLGSQLQSGVALSLRFQNMNSELLNFSRRLEGFERSIFELVNKWLGTSTPVKVSYPQDFNIIDKSLELEVLQNMAALNAPKSYLIEKMKQIISADLAGMNAETEAAIFDELSGLTHERE